MRRIYEKTITLIIVIVVVLLVGIVFETRISVRRAKEELLSEASRSTRYRPAA